MNIPEWITIWADMLDHQLLHIFADLYGKVTFLTIPYEELLFINAIANWLTNNNTILSCLYLKCLWNNSIADSIKLYEKKSFLFYMHLRLFLPRKILIKLCYDVCSFDHFSAFRLGSIYDIFAKDAGIFLQPVREKKAFLKKRALRPLRTRPTICWEPSCQSKKIEII